MNKTGVSFKSIEIDGLKIFYREAGMPGKPTILLLHGFPSSSRMYQNLMNELSGQYHLIAPDYPGFGQSSAPDTDHYQYTFDNLAATVTRFIDKLGLKQFSLYMQDYGGPVGLRIATARPAAIQSLIIQNANAYTEGLGAALAPLSDYMQHPNAETEKAVRGFLTLAATQWQYTDGASDLSKINPDSYITDQYYLDRKGNDLIQLALFRNYITNLALYETWHAYFRKYKPATLVISGKNDQLFTAPGAEAFKKDNPDAQIHLLNGGHFALEEHYEHAAIIILQFLQGNAIR
ncbi:MAG: alpha/beta hydrolase [Chitinophagaceae bacterium]|nr:alpha/beta hydrolase [Chitinophagaceae bacterium]